MQPVVAILRVQIGHDQSDSTRKEETDLEAKMLEKPKSTVHLYGFF